MSKYLSDLHLQGGEERAIEKGQFVKLKSKTKQQTTYNLVGGNYHQ
jgi:hypothetical protein